MRDPHQNIFYYYRGPTKKKVDSIYDIQIEDNTTKSLVNLIEFCHKVDFDLIPKALFELFDTKTRPILNFKLQKSEKHSRPDALIQLDNRAIYIESKVRASLDIEQIKRHLKSLSIEDILVVVTNSVTDRKRISNIQDQRVRHITWADIHAKCVKALHQVKDDKKHLAKINLVNQFIEYLEGIVMTEFCGFRNDDFDFWIDYNQEYVPILKNKMSALAKAIMENLPERVKNIYSFIRVGNIAQTVRDERHAWVAIKKPAGNDIFNQCNFTIEVSKDDLNINTVIRNGRAENSNTPIGVFYRKLETHGEFLKVIKKINKNTDFIIFRRLPKSGKRIMPGNERWVKYFSIKLKDINTVDDVEYLRKVMLKTEFPGIHFKFSIPRGDKVLRQPIELKQEIISTICEFKPILDWLES